MKYFIAFMGIVGLGLLPLWAQTDTILNGKVPKQIVLLPVLVFEGNEVSQAAYQGNALQTLAHDFGKVAVGDSVFHSVTILNNGTAPLVLTNVVPDCECTVAYFTEGEIAVGNRGIIQTGFRVKEAKKIHHTLTVLSNTVSGVDFIELTAEGIDKK